LNLRLLSQRRASRPVPGRLFGRLAAVVIARLFPADGIVESSVAARKRPWARENNTTETSSRFDGRGNAWRA